MNLGTFYAQFLIWMHRFVFMMQSCHPFTDLPDLSLYELLLSYLMTNTVFTLFLDDFLGGSDVDNIPED